MSGMKKLTEDALAMLAGQETEARRDSVRGLFEQGYNVVPYVLALLEGKAGVNGTPESRGFKPKKFGGIQLWEYELGNGQSVFYKQSGDYFAPFLTPQR